jgi:hypothetical protein
VIVFAFGEHIDRPTDDVATSDPGFLEWILKKDVTDEVKAIVRAAMERSRSLARAPARVQ